MFRKVKIFTLDEANATLPQVESVLRELESKYETFQRLEDHLFFEEILEASSPAEAKLQELERTLLGMEIEIAKIQGFGCLLRHPLRGMVDFLACQGSEWICYCWRRGEKGIHYYHSLRGGFLERKPLQEAEPAL